MPTVVITGSSRGFGLEQAKKFRELGYQVAFAGMKEQGFGQIFNVGGYGSNDAMMTGLSIYGTTKRAVTYFTQALAKESEDVTGGKVKVGWLAPGIMIANRKNNARIIWLTNRRAFGRFLTAGFRKRDFFKNETNTDL